MTKRVKSLVVLFIVGTFTSTVAYSLTVVGIIPTWNDLTFRDGFRNEARSVALHRNRVSVGEILGRVASPGTDVVVKAFKAATENLVWTDEFPGSLVFVEAAKDLTIAVAGISPKVG